MQPFIVEPIIIRRTRDRYGRLIKFIETEWKPTCEHRRSICERRCARDEQFGYLNCECRCSNVAEQVHHYNYERVGKECIGPDPKECIGPEPEESEVEDLLAHLMAQNDLIALCRECHAALHAEGEIIG